MRVMDVMTLDFLDEHEESRSELDIGGLAGGAIDGDLDAWRATDPDDAARGLHAGFQ